VSEWFAEGREGWLSAQELVDSKLASEIIADPSDELQFLREEMEEIESRGIGIAALLTTNTGDAHASSTGDGDAATGGGDTGGATGGADGIDDAGGPGEATDTTGADYQAGLAAGRAEQAGVDAERIGALDEQCRKLQSDRDKARSEVDRLNDELAGERAYCVAELIKRNEVHAAAVKTMKDEHAAVVADMQAKLATVQSKCERLVSGGMTFSPDTADKGLRTASDVDPRNRLHPALR
jgi:hypothetical protein